MCSDAQGEEPRGERASRASQRVERVNESSESKSRVESDRSDRLVSITGRSRADKHDRSQLYKRWQYHGYVSSSTNDIHTRLLTPTHSDPLPPYRRSHHHDTKTVYLPSSTRNHSFPAPRPPRWAVPLTPQPTQDRAPLRIYRRARLARCASTSSEPLRADHPGCVS